MITGNIPSSLPIMQLRSGAKIVPNLTPRAKTTKATKKRSQIKDLTPEPTPEPTPNKEERSRDPEVLERWSQANASSPLLRLPQEIKNMIYNLVMDAHVLHIENDHRVSWRWVHCNFICQADLPDPDSDDDANLTPEELAEWQSQMTPQEISDWYEERWEARHDRCQATHHDYTRYTRRHRIGNTWKLPGLLSSCRQIYGEARLIPYSKLTFSFDYPAYFEGWARSLSPAQVAAVQKVRLGNLGVTAAKWEETIGYMLGRLRGVRNIELQLSRPDRYRGDNEGLEDLGRLNLGPATLIVREGFRQVATFTGTPKNGLVRSITASELWG